MSVTTREPRRFSVSSKPKRQSYAAPKPRAPDRRQRCITPNLCRCVSRLWRRLRWWWRRRRLGSSGAGRGSALWALHMLGAKAHADESRRKAAEPRVLIDQLPHVVHAGLRLHREHIADDTFLNKDLHGLHHPRWPLPPPLNLAQDLYGNRPRSERQRENIGCGHRILNGEIDADAADRRHGVGRIADA